MRQILLSFTVGLACGLAIATLSAMSSHTGQLGVDDNDIATGRSLPLHIRVVHDPGREDAAGFTLGRDPDGGPFAAQYSFRDRATAERAADDVLNVLFEHAAGR